MSIFCFDSKPSPFKKIIFPKKQRTIANNKYQRIWQSNQNEFKLKSIER